MRILIASRVYFHFIFLWEKETRAQFLYFIINLKGKQVAFKIPFLLTKNEHVMNNKEGGTA